MNDTWLILEYYHLYRNPEGHRILSRLPQGPDIVYDWAMESYLIRPNSATHTIALLAGFTDFLYTTARITFDEQH
jgi:hypothetical protein